MGISGQVKSMPPRGIDWLFWCFSLSLLTLCLTYLYLITFNAGSYPQSEKGATQCPPRCTLGCEFKPLSLISVALFLGWVKDYECLFAFLWWGNALPPKHYSGKITLWWRKWNALLIVCCKVEVICHYICDIIGGWGRGYCCNMQSVQNVSTGLWGAEPMRRWRIDCTPCCRNRDYPSNVSSKIVVCFKRNCMNEAKRPFILLFKL